MRDAVLRKRRHEDGAKAMRRRQRSTDDEQAHVRLTKKVDDAVAYMSAAEPVSLFRVMRITRPPISFVSSLRKEDTEIMDRLMFSSTS